EPFGRRARGELLADQRQQRLAVRYPVRIRAEAFVVGELRAADPLDKLAEQLVVRGRDHQLAVARREDLVRDDQRERRAEAAGRDATPQRVRQLIADERECGLEERDVDLAAAPGLLALVECGD